MNSALHIGVIALALGTVGCETRPASAPPLATAPAPSPTSAPQPAVAPQPEPVAQAAKSRVFSPSRDGFKFKNSFSGSPLPKIVRGLATQLGASVPKRYGLCGGMSSAAADYYFAGATPPSLQTPPEEGTPLYEYLYERQLDSLGTGMIHAAKVGRWMMLDDRGPDGTQARSKAEMQRIKNEITTRGVALVFLVYGGPDGKTPLWENHQVLAYQADDSEIKIYDPNYPGDDTAQLAITATADGVGVERRTARGNKPVRGIFLGDYEKKTPPG